MAYFDRSAILKALNDEENTGSVFDGHDYEHGELEAQAASVESLQRFCMRLSRALIAKGLFSKKEMIDLIFDYPYAPWGKWDSDPKELDMK